MTDIIDTLAGLAPDSPLALIRDRKPVTRENAQASYRALFEPSDADGVTLQERFALACFVAGLHAQDDIAAFYAAGLARTAPAEPFVAALSAEAARGRTKGPYGAYPKGPLIRAMPALLRCRVCSTLAGRTPTSLLYRSWWLFSHFRSAPRLACGSSHRPGTCHDRHPASGQS